MLARGRSWRLFIVWGGEGRRSLEFFFFFFVPGLRGLLVDDGGDHGFFVTVLLFVFGVNLLTFLETGARK